MGFIDKLVVGFLLDMGLVALSDNGPESISGSVLLLGVYQDGLDSLSMFKWGIDQTLLEIGVAIDR